MTVVLVGRDLLFGSRIAGAADRAGHAFLRVDDPLALPPASSVHLVLIDWAERRPMWGVQLSAWAASASTDKPRLLLFGPHTDLVAHADARAADLGPMWARSKLVARLPSLVVRPEAFRADDRRLRRAILSVRGPACFSSAKEVQQQRDGRANRGAHADEGDC